MQSSCSPMAHPGFPSVPWGPEDINSLKAVPGKKGWPGLRGHGSLTDEVVKQPYRRISFPNDRLRGSNEQPPRAVNRRPSLSRPHSVIHRPSPSFCPVRTWPCHSLHQPSHSPPRRLGCASPPADPRSFCCPPFCKAAGGPGTSGSCLHRP